MRTISAIALTTLGCSVFAGVAEFLNEVALTYQYRAPTLDLRK